MSEVSLDTKSEFKSEHILQDKLGNIIKTQKKYAENTSELTYIERKLYYLNTLWFGAISTIDHEAKLDRYETLFIFKEISNSNGKIKPTKDIIDNVYNEVENPKSELPF